MTQPNSGPNFIPSPETAAFARHIEAILANGVQPDECTIIALPEDADYETIADLLSQHHEFTRTSVRDIVETEQAPGQTDPVKPEGLLITGYDPASAKHLYDEADMRRGGRAFDDPEYCFQFYVKDIQAERGRKSVILSSGPPDHRLFTTGGRWVSGGPFPQDYDGSYCGIWEIAEDPESGELHTYMLTKPPAGVGEVPEWQRSEPYRRHFA